MAYKIISGQYELGTQEQQAPFKLLFGEENIRYKFDLYFHWYNLLHEMGHCLLEDRGITAEGVQAEMFVNEFAVAYWREVGCGARIEELKALLEQILADTVSPIPEGEKFEEYFERIWETEALDDVNIYGYFQFRCVLEAMKYPLSFARTVSQANIHVHKDADIESYEEEICAENAHKVMASARKNLSKWGIELPAMELQLVKNPMIQCAQYISIRK